MLFFVIIALCWIMFVLIFIIIPVYNRYNMETIGLIAPKN